MNADNAGPTGSEYASDLENAKLRNRLGTAITVGVLLLLALNAYGTFILNPQQREESDFDIRQSQHDVCEKSGNALRGDVRQEFVDLKEKVLIPVFRQVRNTIPPEAASYEILDGAVKQLYGRASTITDRIPDAACSELYPPLPGQTYER